MIFKRRKNVRPVQPGRSILEAENAEAELSEIVETLPQQDQSEPRQETSTLQQVWDMVRDEPTRKALLLGCGMMALQQLCGINTIMYYSASIYRMSQFDENNSRLNYIE